MTPKSFLMNKRITRFFAVFLIVLIYNSAQGQTDSDSLINMSMTFELKNDTLYSNTGLKFYKGQKLIIGNNAGANRRYRSILSDRAALVPSIWGQDKRYNYAIENYVDSKKNREKMKKLIPGQVLTITGIGLSKTGKPHFYSAGLTSGADRYYCDLKLALNLRELLIQP